MLEGIVCTDNWPNLIWLTYAYFQAKKVDLKERLIADWEDKKRQVENDKIHMELSMGKRLIPIMLHADRYKPCHLSIMSSPWP